MNFYNIYYKILFRIFKIKYGKNLKIRGKIFIENLMYCNLEIGDDVEISPFVHLKFYKNTKIILKDKVKLDFFTRIVVANNSIVEIGKFSKIGKSTILNAGANIKIGEKNLIAQNCSINSSEHKFKKNLEIINQGYHHSEVILEDDIWLGANVIINPGSIIRKHSVIGAGCIIKGEVKENSIVKNENVLSIKKNES